MASNAGAASAGPDGFEPPDTQTVVALVFTNLGIQTGQELAAAYAANTAGDEVESCMVDEGYARYEFVSEIDGDPLLSMSDADYANTNGFGIVAQAAGTYPTPPDPNSEFVASLSGSARAAFVQSEARCRLGSDPQARLRYFNAFAVAFADFSAELALSDEAVAAVDTWHGCLLRSGYDFVDPSQMRFFIFDKLSRASDLGALSAEEIALAVANVPCEQAYKSVYRDLVVDRIGEFDRLLSEAIESDGQISGG